ncbi:MAG TPA: DUF433 domain-containing protein [Polyangiaceae bacterium]|nr:DUF433 domain-containing protein [Polyangiaceae bacterium]
MTAFGEHFEQKSTVAGGTPVLRGTRIPVRSVVASLAEGASEADILRAFPSLTSEQVRAVVTFAASLALKSLTSKGDEAETEGESDD